MKSLLLLSIATLTFTGCATTSNNNNKYFSLKEQMDNGLLTVSPIDNPAKLAERTKAQAFGKFVVNSVVSSVAASADARSYPNAMNAQTMSNNMQKSMQFGQEVGSQLTGVLPDGYKVEAGNGTDLAIAKKLAEHVSVSQTKAATPQYLLQVGAPVWELAYVSFLTSQDYALNYNFTAVVYDTGEAKHKVVSQANCKGTAKERMPLEAWHADNNKVLNQSAEAIVSECYNKLVAGLGIN
jgi:hypothetical protein